MIPDPDTCPCRPCATVRARRNARRVFFLALVILLATLYPLWLCIREFIAVFLTK